MFTVRVDLVCLVANMCKDCLPLTFEVDLSSFQYENHSMKTFICFAQNAMMIYASSCVELASDISLNCLHSRNTRRRNRARRNPLVVC